MIASAEGFTLGLAYDGKGTLYMCDLKHAAVFKLDMSTRILQLFADGDEEGNKINIPNFPVIDSENGCLYVSDSHHPEKEGPGIWRFDLASGQGEMWYNGPIRFANGLVFSTGRDAIYVAETFARRISKIPILADGRPGDKQIVTQVDALPDGLALDLQGRLYISCYEPSLIYRWSESSGLDLLYYDPDAHTLCHPTNCALQGNDLYTANLGRWHISKIHDVL